MFMEVLKMEKFHRISQQLRQKGGGVLPKRKIYMAVTKDAPREKDAPQEDTPQEKKEIRRSRQSGEFDGEIFRERIRLLRKESGMTKKDFAAFTGIAYITLYNYERKDIVPGADMLFRIAAGTGCSVDWLIGLKEEEEK